MTEDEMMVGCLNQLNGHNSEQALRIDDGQGALQSMGSQGVGHN